MISVLRSLSVCSSLHNQTSSQMQPQKYTCLNIDTKALTHIDHQGYGNTAARYSQGHNRFPHFTDFLGIERGARRRELLTHQTPTHTTARAATPLLRAGKEELGAKGQQQEEPLASSCVSHHRPEHPSERGNPVTALVLLSVKLSSNGMKNRLRLR